MAYVSAECIDCPTIEIQVPKDCTRAEMAQPAPVEAYESGDWYQGRIHVLLFVANGILSSLEVWREDGSSVKELPSPEDLIVILGDP